ncbi:expressed unknown protein [Ectocarpus siliculosus]|uniref:Uncharacterized protein n=1 Tax=Ectocarpus siliculosus TaxID=2880 RepID=D7FVT4_ECTSI|nr:expressed unknown protein [Ectocarpus siliculosus]|eukprot:CBJ25454.1 expressed unknown protein [Ectocarpus siliculosus]
MRGGQLHPKPRAASRNHGYLNGGGFDGIGHGRGLDGWSAHVRYFLARYPPETRDLVAQRLASYGIRSLLSSHRQENLSLDALLAATDAADREVLSSMREHARGRHKQRGAAAPLCRSRTSSPQRQQRQHPRANGGNAAAPTEVLRERVLADKNIDAGPPGAAGAVTVFRKRHVVAARPDVLTRYPFVDDLAATQGGGVGAVMHQATPTTPIQYLAKREIRRLAHEAFRELKASALGIRLSDLPCALQFLFFGDSASLLTSKGGGGGGGGDGGGGARGAKRSAKDVHLVMALARECLPPTLAHAARDTSTLSTASTQGGAEAGGWMRDGQNMFVSERRWIKVVAHVIRRLWDMDGRPEDVAAAGGAAGAAAQRRRRTISTAAAGPSRKPATVAATAAPFGMEFQQPVWKPVGGRRGSVAAAAATAGGSGGGGGRFLRGGEAENVTSAESFLGGLEADSRSDTTGWGGFSAASRISASDGDGGPYPGEGGGGGGDDDDEALRAWEEAEDWVGAGRSIARAPGEEQEEHARGEAGGLFAAPRGLGAVHGSRRRRKQSGGAGDAGRIAGARRSAVRDTVARRRLDRLDRGSSLGDATQGFPADGRSGVSGDGDRDRGGSSLAAEWDSNARGHTPGEHALDIAGAFLESSLMTRLAGGDWFDGEDGDQISAGSSAAWEPEGAVRGPLGGGPRQTHRPGGALRGRYDSGGGGGSRSRNGLSRRDGGQRAGRREAHTGWLGDFGPVHTHTVREVAGDVEEEEEEGRGEEEEESGDGRAWGTASRRDGGVSPPRDHGGSDGGTTSRQGSGGHAEEKGRGGVGEGGSGDVSASEDVREGRGVDESTGAARGSDGGGATREGSDPGGGGSTSPNDNDDGDVGLGQGETGDFNVVAPLDGGLDAYLQLASDGGAVVGGGAAGGGGGDEEGGREGPGLGGGSPGGYTGATSGSWWEEDRSALEGGDVIPGPT